MKRTLIAATALMAMMSTSAIAQSIGASISRFDDNFLTVMRNGMTDHAASLDGVDLQVEGQKYRHRSIQPRQYPCK